MVKFSLYDFIRNVLYTVGGILAILASIAQIKSTVPEFVGLNLWWWVIIAIGLAIILTIIQQFIRRGNSPIIKIEVQHNDFTKKLYTDVINKGTEGLFGVQFRVIESSDVLLEANQGIYRGCWEENRTAEVTIRHGETKRLLIAEFHKGSYSGFLRIFGETFGHYYQLNHSYFLGGGNKDVIIPEVFLILTISTSPIAWRGSKTFALRIWANDRYEVCYNIPRKLGMPKIKDIDTKKLKTTKQDFEALLKKACSTKPKSSPKQSKT
jgi:hypothetical protein